MPLFLFMFGFETPTQHRSSTAAGRDDEDSRAVFIESSDAVEALGWGREIAERFVRQLWARAGAGEYSWKSGQFAHWVETRADELARAETQGVPHVKVGEHFDHDVIASAPYPNLPRQRDGAHEQHRVETIAPAAHAMSVDADRLAAAGKVAEARTLMQAAAELDRAYAIRARTVGQADARRIRLSETIRKALIPFFAELGFKPRGGGKWSMGEFLERERDGCHQSILVGRDKFGGRVGVASAQYRSPDHVEWYSWRQAGIRQGALAYKTQTDLEAACVLWRELVSEYLVPWWDGCR